MRNKLEEILEAHMSLETSESENYSIPFEEFDNVIEHILEAHQEEINKLAIFLNK